MQFNINVIKEREKLFFVSIQNFLNDLGQHAGINGKVESLRKARQNKKNGEITFLGIAILEKIDGDIIGRMTFAYIWTFLDQDIQELYPTGEIVISMKGKSEIADGYDVEERNLLLHFITKHLVKFKTLANNVKIELERSRK